jgi:acyl-CoA dehydrogenase
MNILKKLQGEHSAPTESFGSVSEWLSFLDKLSTDLDPLERTIFAGYHADRLGYAFCSGYLAATKSLFGSDRTALCATENIKGAPPNSIQTKITPQNGKLVLNGEKSFVTLGKEVNEIAVLVKKEEITKILLIPSKHVSFVSPKRSISFIPEIAHCAVRFDNLEVKPEWILDGDGFQDYTKPFRTVEDIFVFGAFLGYLYRVCRKSNWNRTIAELILVQVFTLYHLGASEENVLSPYTHVVFDGLRREVMTLIEEIEKLEWFNKEEFSRFQRDKPILFVAQQIRDIRTKKAWNSLKSGQTNAKL